MNASETMHASAALIGEEGVLIRGRSGSGKSSLLLGLIAADPVSTWLVADDRVDVSAHDGRLVAKAPEAIAGKLEVRGQGIVDLVHVAPVVLRFAVDLFPPDDCPRLPEEDQVRVSILGVELPRLMLPIGAFDGPARVRAALRRLRAVAPPEKPLPRPWLHASCVAESIGQDSAPRHRAAAGGISARD
jgi:HPr kinase/phosphorylase